MKAQTDETEDYVVECRTIGRERCDVGLKGEIHHDYIVGLMERVQ